MFVDELFLNLDIAYAIFVACAIVFLEVKLE